MLKRLQQAVIESSNVFEVLVDAVRVCSLVQITNARLRWVGNWWRFRVQNQGRPGASGHFLGSCWASCG